MKRKSRRRGHRRHVSDVTSGKSKAARQQAAPSIWSPRLVLATHLKSSPAGHAHHLPGFKTQANHCKSATATKPIQAQSTKNLAGRTMATPFCAAAACRLSVAAPPAAQAPRPRRGLVAVRAEAGAGGGINPTIRKEEEKVVDTVLTGELAKPLTAYCRYG